MTKNTESVQGKESVQTGHTPGPWIQNPTGDIGRWAVGNSQKLTADCRGDFDDCDPELEANARLIAAAPELLKACKALISPTTFGQKGHVCFIDAVGLARAAIAKAEGTNEN